MKIIFLPLNCSGMLNLETQTIFLSLRYNFLTLVDTIKHELAHIIHGNELHNNKWFDIYIALGGKMGRTEDFYRNTFVANVGNVTGIQNILTDYHLLQAYRKFSQRVLGTEGQWELKGDNQIRLFPTPRGSFPVVLEYYPHVYRFDGPTGPTEREITKRALVAEAKIILGNARSKFGNIPAPDGSSLNLNGEAMRTEGQAEKEKALQDAILLSDPLGIHLW